MIHLSLESYIEMGREHAARAEQPVYVKTAAGEYVLAESKFGMGKPLYRVHPDGAVEDMEEKPRRR